MAWRTANMEQRRKEFIECYLEKKTSLSELSRQFGISRPIAYKWINRFKQSSWEGLKNLSKAPKTQAKATSIELEYEIIAVKLAYLRWGPKKIKSILEKEHPNISWPSETTIGKICERNGLTIPRVLRRRLPIKENPLSHSQQCNDVWCIDFKGWFLTQDSHKCDAFTVTDAFSRYLLSCTKLHSNNTAHAWGIFDRLFREYGLPKYVRSDNGPPFATCSPGRLSKLSVNLIKAGVMPEWIEPGKPQQNGRHERMHLTMQQECVFPELTLKEQEIKFSEFANYFNFIRPHEALGQVSPSELYQPSNRVWNGRLQPPEYSDEYKICRVRDCGKMSWKSGDIWIGRVLGGELVGVKNENGELKAYYGPIYLGIIDQGELKVSRRPPRVKTRLNSGRDN